MSRYFIRKLSRPCSKGPYAGPTCLQAGVPEGKWYDDKDEAEKDAEMLTMLNPVGFEVVECTEEDCKDGE